MGRAPRWFLLSVMLGFHFGCGQGATQPGDLGRAGAGEDLSGAASDGGQAAASDMAGPASQDLLDATADGSSELPTRAFYVATSGADTNSGTSAKPWRTVAHAVATMVAGDTTYVRGGLYKEHAILFAVSGTKTAPIRLLAAPGEAPIIDCIDKANLDRILIENRVHEKAMGWITIEGFEIRNCYNGIKFANVNDMTLRENWIHDNQTSGLLGNGTRVVIDRNIINHNGSVQPFDHGMYMHGTGYTITNNLVYDNNSYGIQLNGSDTSLYDPQREPGPEYALSADWLIANNTFAYSQNRAGIVVWGSTCNNARIINNIFYENGVALPTGAVNGIAFTSTTCTGIQIRNNLAYASGSGATAFLGTDATEGVQYTQSGNLVNLANPGFVNAGATLPAMPDFALLSTSPAIDKGLSLPEVTTDFLGTPRPQGAAVDIGAYEFR